VSSTTRDRSFIWQYYPANHQPGVCRFIQNSHGVLAGIWRAFEQNALTAAGNSMPPDFGVEYAVYMMHLGAI
jgi:hypothetical protein